MLGAVNYIAGPIKPNPKPIELPTGTFMHHPQLMRCASGIDFHFRCHNAYTLLRHAVCRMELRPLHTLHEGHGTAFCHAGFSPAQPTSLQDLESTLQKLESKKDEWANLTTLKRAELLRKTLACVLEVRAEAWECCNHPCA